MGHTPSHMKPGAVSLPDGRIESRCNACIRALYPMFENQTFMSLLCVIALCLLPLSLITNRITQMRDSLICCCTDVLPQRIFGSW